MLDNNKDIFGWSYLIMPKMPGKNIKHSGLLENYNLEEQKRIIKAMVKCLTEMQKLTFKYTGKFDLESKSIQKFENGYVQEMKSRVEQRLKMAMKNDRITSKKDIEWALKIIENNLNDLEITKGTFVMQDFKLENMVFSKSDNKWKVSGIFDLMESYSGFGESDLARTYARFIDNDRKDLAEYIIKEYVNLKNKNIENIKHRLKAFLIIDRVIIWEWMQRNPSKIKSESFRNWVRKYF